MNAIHYHTKSNGQKLAYMQDKRSKRHVVFLSGFKSNMHGSKAEALSLFCDQHNLSYTRFDYRGHGLSDGEFSAGCISDWLEDTLDILTHCVAQPCMLVGSSMGGWLALLAALRLPHQITGLVGIAAAADFTEKLIWQHITPAQRQTLLDHGSIALPSCYGEEDYIITHKLITDGRNHLLLNAPIAINCPVRLLHGMADNDVPWQISTGIAQQLTSEDVEIHLIKNAGHRMSDAVQLDALMAIINGLLPRT